MAHVAVGMVVVGLLVLAWGSGAVGEVLQWLSPWQQ